MIDEIEIEPGISAGHYIVRTDPVSFAINVRPDDSWGEIEALALAKYQQLKDELPRNIVILPDGSTFDNARGAVVALNVGDWRPDSNEPMPAGCELMPVSELIRFWKGHRAR